MYLPTAYQPKSSIDLRVGCNAIRRTIGGTVVFFDSAADTSDGVFVGHTTKGERFEYAYDGTCAADSSRNLEPFKRKIEGDELSAYWARRVTEYFEGETLVFSSRKWSARWYEQSVEIRDGVPHATTRQNYWTSVAQDTLETIDEDYNPLKIKQGNGCFLLTCNGLTFEGDLLTLLEKLAVEDAA